MRKILLTLLLTCCALPSLAAEPSTESLDRLFRVTHAEDLVLAMRKQTDEMIGPMLLQAMDAKNLPADRRQELEAVLQRFRVKFNRIMAEELSWPRMRELQMQIYRESFSQEEIDDLIRFYESPTGQRFIQKMPVVMQKTMLHTQQRMVSLRQKIAQAAAETAREFKAEKKSAN